MDRKSRQSPISLEEWRDMGLPPTLPDLFLTDEERLPVGTLLYNDVSEEFGIVVGYWAHGSYKLPRSNWTDWGYKELHTVYMISLQHEINVAIEKHPETGYCEWKVI
jgi:hypothetical protein